LHLFSSRFRATQSSLWWSAANKNPAEVVAGMQPCMPGPHERSADDGGEQQGEKASVFV
jgi:hypothetical protein